MQTLEKDKEILIQKIRSLSQEKIKEVEDFIDFLTYKEKKEGLTYRAAKAAEPSFQRVWDNPEDAEYDQL